MSEVSSDVAQPVLLNKAGYLAISTLVALVVSAHVYSFAWVSGYKHGFACGQQPVELRAEDCRN